MTKLKIKLGEVEIDYEGPEEFLKQDFPEFLKTLSALQVLAPKARSESKDNQSGKNGDAPTTDLGITTIAAKMAVKTGPDLALAAAAFLTFTKAKPKFGRSDILDEMKNATGYFNANHAKNLSGALNTLSKDQALVVGAGGEYSLGANKKTELEALLATK